MKNTLSLLCLTAIISVVSCKKDTDETEISNVSSAYKTLLYEYTAEWCPPCGSNSYPAYKTVTANNPHDMCLLNIHPSDDVSSGTALGQAEMVTFYGFSGTPQGAVNHNKQFGFPADVNANTTTLQNHVNNGKKLIAKAGVGISKTISGGKLEIKTKTVFFEDLTGIYNVAVYVTENGLISDQTTKTSPIKNAVHDHVFRGAANSVWGKKAGTNPTKGTIVDDVCTFTIPSDVKNTSNLKIVAVIWKMDAGVPVGMINCNKE